MKLFIIPFLLSMKIVGTEISSLTSNTIDTKNNISIFYFFSPSCPCSLAHLEHMRELKQNFPFQFTGILSKKNISLEKAKDFIKNKNLNFSVLMDDDLKIADKFRAIKTPQVFVYEGEELLYQGAITNSLRFKNAKNFYLKEVLEKLKLGKKIKVTMRKSLGCYIRR